MYKLNLKYYIEFYIFFALIIMFNICLQYIIVKLILYTYLKCIRFIRSIRYKLAKSS